MATDSMSVMPLTDRQFKPASSHKDAMHHIHGMNFFGV
jgi:hypothetical protein